MHLSKCEPAEEMLTASFKERTSLSTPELLTAASEDWKKISAESSPVPLRRHKRSWNRTELKCEQTFMIRSIGLVRFIRMLRCE